MASLHVNEGDEAAFIELAESTITGLQKLARGKLALQYTAVLEACMKLEDMACMEALKDVSLPSSHPLWQSRRAIEAYQDICETMMRNLESRVAKDWPQKFQEQPPLRLFRQLSGRTTSLAFAETAPLQRKRRGGDDGPSGQRRKKKSMSGGAAASHSQKGQGIPKASEIGIQPSAPRGPGQGVPKFEPPV